MAPPPQKTIGIESHCAAIVAEASRNFPGTELHFILHHMGQREEQTAKTLSKVSGHPAYAEARGLLKFRKLSGDQSSFLGLALGYEKRFLGLRSAPKGLAFISINLSEHENEETKLLTLYQLTGQFLDLMESLKNVKKPPERGVIMQPKRNNLSVARSNLKTDVFGALHIAREKNSSIIDDLARKRGMASITARADQHPEEYPFPIAMDVVNYAVEHLTNSRQGSMVMDSFQTAQSIVQSFEKENLETWIQFTKSAQSMAWSGYTPQQILGAAVHTSPNPFIKATGHLVAEVTDITPLPEESLPSGYNPYIADEINQINHQRMIEDTLDMVLIHAVESDSHLPLVRVANNQNENLVKGRFSGWCAHALQAAAKAYIGASQRGVPADLAAKVEFQTVQQKTQWQDLQRVTDFVIEQHRSGEGVTLSSVAQWCSQSPELRAFTESINLTLSDPTYAAKLKLSNDMPSIGPALAAAPSAAPQPSYQPSMGMVAAPQFSFGGGGMMGGTPAVRKASPPPKPEEKLLLVEDEE